MNYHCKKELQKIMLIIVLTKNIPVYTTAKQKGKHKKPEPEPGIEPGHLSPQSKVIPVGYRVN